METHCLNSKTGVSASVHAKVSQFGTVASQEVGFKASEKSQQCLGSTPNITDGAYSEPISEIADAKRLATFEKHVPALGMRLAPVAKYLRKPQLQPLLLPRLGEAPASKLVPPQRHSITTAESMAFIGPLPVLARNTMRTAIDKRPARHPTPHARPRMTAAQKQTIRTAWPAFAERMKSTNQVPPVDDWHFLFDIAVEAREDPKMVIWLLNLMREAGLKPTAVTYEKALHVCALREDRPSAFHLVELMFGDKVLLGDVELPGDMEDLLRKILPPEAFE